MSKIVAPGVPSIEQREGAWTHLQERLARAARSRVLPCVTISREFGCEGYPLAQRLKVLLEASFGQPWSLFDKAMVDQVASDENLSRQLLAHLGDESHAQDVLRTHFGFLTHNEAYARLVQHIVQIASAGAAIIVGRGGAVVCQDLRNCFHVRLVGSFAFRAANLARRRQLSTAEAEALVRTQSRLRETFIRECLHADIADVRWYDAVLNNERLGVESIAQTCLRLVEQRWAESDGAAREPRHLLGAKP
jgi:cytidylate kinase